MVIFGPKSLHKKLNFIRTDIKFSGREKFVSYSAVLYVVGFRARGLGCVCEISATRVWEVQEMLIPSA